METYNDFLRKKSQGETTGGFEPSVLPDFLFDFQRHLVEWAIRKGRGALFVDTGLGKTIQQLVWAENVVRHTNKPVLILTPLAVSFQTINEAHKFGIDAERARDGTFTGTRIVVTNYEQLGKFSPDDFSGTVCDECFPAGTLVDTPSGRYAIETIPIGAKILNASGIDTVARTHKREVPYAVAITLHQNARIVCSPSHPVFTGRGWVRAQDLKPGDALLQTSAAMRMVRGGISSAPISSIRPSKVLREILLSEMADEPTATSRKSAYGGGRSQERSRTFRMVRSRVTSGASRQSAYRQTQPDDRSSNPRAGLADSQADGTQAIGARREWAWTDNAATDSPGCIGGRVGQRGEYSAGGQNAGISYGVQTGLREPITQNRHRSGWVLALQPEESRYKEGCEAGFVRVDRLEILEQGHPELERCRASDGKLYFYDLTATRHPSFSVNGLLVHNSGVLKNFDSVTRKAVTEFMRKQPYRLLCTATPSPNDYIELGTSSEALGELGYMDMLTRFFKNDQNTSKPMRQRFKRGQGPVMDEGSKWRFKGHAQLPFWRWVCSWARAMRKPSDLGFDDTRFLLPPLIEQEHLITDIRPPEEMLFTLPAVGLQEQRGERRRTIEERCEKVAALVNHTGKPAIAWCHLNAEGDLLEKLIPNAVQVSGADEDEEKEEKLLAFVRGQARVMISKPVVFGYGLNLQNCAHMTFFPSHSFSEYYQAVRRCYRFGQVNPVTVDIVTTPGEQSVLKNLKRKAAQADIMFDSLVRCMSEAQSIERESAFTKEVMVPKWL